MKSDFSSIGDNMKRVLLVVVLPAFFIFLGCGSKPSAMEKIKKSGEITIGIANEIPYGYKTPGGEIKGEGPDVAREVLSRMGITKVKGVVTEFGSLIPGLRAGRFDIIVAGMYITPKRCRQVLFSEPTYSIGESFLVPKGNPRGLKSYEDVRKNKDIKLGVMGGAVEQGYARAMGIPKEQIVVLPDNFSGLDAVRSGRIDAYAGTSLTIAKLAAKNSSVDMVVDFVDPVIKGKKIRGFGAVAFRKEDKAFRDEFNRYLKDFIGTKKHRAMVSVYGFTKANLPGKKTAAELCAGK
jgi:polar amino acid transport system substrate-binding protein